MNKKGNRPSPKFYFSGYNQSPRLVSKKKINYIYSMSILFKGFVYFCRVYCYFFYILKFLLRKIKEQTKKHLKTFKLYKNLIKNMHAVIKTKTKLSCSSISLLAIT